MALWEVLPSLGCHSVLPGNQHSGYRDQRSVPRGRQGLVLAQPNQSLVVLRGLWPWPDREDLGWDPMACDEPLSPR